MFSILLLLLLLVMLATPFTLDHPCQAGDLTYLLLLFLDNPIEHQRQ